MRILLGGVAPARILCLTYTKAAAANMAERIFATLAKWTALDDAALGQAIMETGAPAASATDLAFARKLFARTIETPGGLKIQTIHAFCDRLLHLFPFEANVAAGFEQLDEATREVYLAEAQRQTLAEAAQDAAHDGPLAQAVAVVARETNGREFGERVRDALKMRLLGEIDPSQDAARLRAALGLGADETEVSLLAEFAEAGDAPKRWIAMAEVLDNGLTTDTKRAGKLRAAAAFCAEGDIGGAFETWLAIALTSEGKKQSSLMTQKLALAHPEMTQALTDEQARILALHPRLLGAAAVTRTQALLMLAGAVVGRYEARKAARGKLDFDDLIERTRLLLDEQRAAWVLYKLDAGIDHVLVDEAQDLSPAQWDVLDRLVNDFFSGRGARETVRTFFAVGDPKQSIFAFQGARPGMFSEMRAHILQRADGAERAQGAVKLNQSFRSVSRVLEAVDMVFEPPAHHRGLEGPRDHAKTAHTSWKGDIPGLVEIWPVVARTDPPVPADWRTPVDLVDADAPPALVAASVAQKIAELIAPGSSASVHDDETGRPRPVRAGDILVLVRTRSAFFNAVIRAMKDRGVAVAGADRLVLIEHIAVMDLVAAGRAALLAGDDLALACVLKSPLFGFSDDDLVALAAERKASLDAALSASQDARCADAARRIARWRERARGDTPFGFYMALLSAERGRAALCARLGGEAGDAIDEFTARALAYEKDHPPSLSGFLQQMEADAASIKRDMDARGDAVRVMTVHASKGLEAKIVFLPDTCSVPPPNKSPKLFALTDGDAPSLRANRAVAPVAWSQRKDDDAPAIAMARARAADADDDEYRRLLYVALTRAEERLYVAGFRGTAALPPACWYEIIRRGLGAVLEQAQWSGKDVLRFGKPPEATFAAGTGVTPQPMETVPPWLFAPAAAEAPPAPPLSPANALTAAENETAPVYAVLAEAAQRARFRNGELIHRLLQYAPDMPPAARASAMQRFLDREAGDLAPERRAELANSVTDVIEAERLAPLFAKGSVAEASITGRIARAGREPLAVSGRIDRLSATDDEVWIADYKSGEPAPRVPDAYIGQLALYRAVLASIFPERRVRALIVWTQGPSVVELEAGAMDAALEAIKLR